MRKKPRGAADGGRVDPLGEHQHRHRIDTGPHRLGNERPPVRGPGLALTIEERRASKSSSVSPAGSALTFDTSVPDAGAAVDVVVGSPSRSRSRLRRSAAAAARRLAIGLSVRPGCPASASTPSVMVPSAWTVSSVPPVTRSTDVTSRPTPAVG